MRIGVHSGAFVSAILVLCLAALCPAVTSKIVRHESSAQMSAGEVENVVIGSRGSIELGRSVEVLVDDFGPVWSINSIVVVGGEFYVGTSPNGGVYRYSMGELARIYPQPDEMTVKLVPAGYVRADANDANEPEAEFLTNEHIFAMRRDIAGRLLVGISGKECRLCRLEKGRFVSIFEPEDTMYIFAILVDPSGDIYLGTGPQGIIYKTDSFGRKAEVFYDSPDKNILSLAAGDDGAIYAGSDTRGLVYRIESGSGRAKVLYDSEQPEITALLRGEDGHLYAAATSAEAVATQNRFSSKAPQAGKPESKQPESDKQSESTKLQIPDTQEQPDEKKKNGAVRIPGIAAPNKGSNIYRITKEGFVKGVFSENAVLFCLLERQGRLLIGAGNRAKLFSVDPATEDEATLFEDEQASQVTSAALFDKDVLIGTANPAKLLRLEAGYAPTGEYVSDLIDAGQPAKWGKLQIEADIPRNCKVMVCSRSGNVQDVNDPTFSDWTAPLEVTGPVQLRCPMGRFCQYKLILLSPDKDRTPVIREVAVAGTVANIAPQVTAVSVGRLDTKGKEGVFKINFSATDFNKDTLVYKVDFRKVGRTGWIELTDDLETPSFEWDGKTVEDGRYEVRVIASDRMSNTSETTLTGSRVSEAVVIDNTGPAITDTSVQVDKADAKVELKAVDRFSSVAELHYTVDSNEKWVGTVPNDMVFDTTEESFTIVIEDLEPGEHVVAVRAKDAAGNTTYKSLEVHIAGAEQ